MKKIVFVVLLIGLVVGSVYYFLGSKRNSSIEVQQVLPETSLFVIHISDLDDDINAAQSKGNLSDVVPEFSSLVGFRQSLDSLSDIGLIPDYLLKLELWISIHSNGSDGLNTLFITRSNGFQWNPESIKKILELISGKAYVQSQQVLNGQVIYSLAHDESSISFGIDGEFFFWSSETLLVEDVIRAKKEPAQRLLRNDDSRFLDSRIYLNGKRLNELSRVFLLPNADALENTSLLYFLDVGDNEPQLSINGYGLSHENRASSETELFAKNLIPGEAASIKWSPESFNTTQNLSTIVSPNTLEVRLETGEKVWIFETRDTSSLVRELNNLAEQLLTPSDSIIYNEEFMYTKIGYINDRTYLPKLNDQFDATDFYYSVFRNTWILSPSVEALKSILIDFDEERTMGRDIKDRQILDDLIQQTNYTMIKNFHFGMDHLVTSLRPKWQDYIEENPVILNSLNRLIIQVNEAGRQDLISGSLSLNKLSNELNEGIEEKLENKVSANVFAEKSINTKPFVLRNHLDGSMEVVFQDESNKLYLTNMQGEVLWTKVLDGPIIGNLEQIDFYNNKKLQIFTATDSLIHLIDRNGNNVDGFPKAYSTNQGIKGVKVIDYDNSKRYRYLFEGDLGELTLLNKLGEPLEGWNPKLFDNGFQVTPFHTRVRGRDCFILIDYLGEFSLLNRRAELYNGFPVNTELRLSGDVFFKKGADFQSSSLTMIGKDGLLLEINLLGNVVRRKQFFKPITETSFQLVVDVTGSGFKILEQSRDKFIIRDAFGASLFEMTSTSEHLKVDYYNFRNGKGIYTFWDTKNKRLKLMAENGRILADNINCDQSVSLLYYQRKQEYLVFVNFENQLNHYTVNAR